MNAKLFSLRNIGIFIIIGALALISYQIIKTKAASKAPETASVESRKTSLSVETIKAVSQYWPTTINVNGGVFPWQEAVVSSEISGLRIKRVLVDVGSQVKRGQPLVALADDTVSAALQKQQAVVARDKATLAEAKQNADRAREIQDSGALSRQKINNYFIAEQTAQANLALSQAELKNQQLRMAQTNVLAPDHGVIASRSANLGDVVSAGTELFRLIRQNRIEWRAEVNTKTLGFLQKGQTVRIAQDNDNPINGVVRMISPTVDAQSRNALVYIDLPKNSAKPGMYLSGTIDIGEQSAIVVPQSSVVLRDGMAYLFEVQDGAVKQQKVITGRSQDDMVEVLAGANLQASYVLTGGAFLNDGDVVKVIENDGAKP